MPVFVEFEYPTSADGRYMTIYGKDKILLNRRLLHGLTQEKLSDITKVSVQQIQKLEAGELKYISFRIKKRISTMCSIAP